MPRRLLVLALAALALLIGTGCADNVSPAVRVGGAKLGNEAFLDEVAEWAGNPAAVNQAMLGDPSPGTFPLELARQLLQQRIDFMLHNAKFKALGLTLDDAMRDDAITALFGDVATSKDAVKAFSKDFARSFMDDAARQIAVTNELGDAAYGEWRTKAYAETDIEVSPRYGSWDSEKGEVVAPPGPVQPSTTTTAPAP